MTEAGREFIPVAGPWITRKEIDAVADAAERGWYASAGEYPSRFEQAFARYVGRRFAVTLPSCTSAIHLALAAWGVGPGDEVVVPDLTWIASSAPVTYVGARPVFADVDARSWCLSPESFESILTPRTRVVIAVDLYGHVFDADKIVPVAKKRGIRVLEDAAQAVGSEYGGRKAGAFGDAGVFSFHGSKTLTTGEGGMLVTDDPALHERVMRLRDHGRAPGDRMFRNLEVGFKYKMSALQAALGLAQLERVDELVGKKREIHSWYHEDLAGLDGVVLNAEAPATKNSYWMTTAVWDVQGPAKEDVMARLAEKGVDSRPFFHPLSSLPAYADAPEASGARERNRTAYRVSARGMNLPSPLNLTRAQARRASTAFKEALACPILK